MSDSSSNNSSEENSSKISSVEDSENVSSKISSKKEKDKDKSVSNDFKEKIISFIKVDDLIRKKQEEIKELKDKKEEFEEYILKFMDKSEASFVNIPGGKLIKNQSESKAPLKIEVIKESIIEGIKKEKLTDSEEVNKKVIEEIIELMEIKRGKVNRINLKRTFERTTKKKPAKK
jgi:hypothetical protein